MPILLGLLASLLIGTSDFLGARSAGRTTALQTTTAAFLGGGVAAMFYSPLLGNPRFEDIALGALSGVALAIALTTRDPETIRSTGPPPAGTRSSRQMFQSTLKVLE